MKLKSHNHQALKIWGAWEYKRKKEREKKKSWSERIK